MTITSGTIKIGDIFNKGEYKKGVMYIIVGRTGSGKSRLKNAVLKHFNSKTEGLSTTLEVLQATTRPQRKDEIHGLDYLFVSDQTFDSMNLLAQETFHAEFGIVRYGVPSTAQNVFNKRQILVTSPKSALDIRFKLGRDKCKIIYVNSPEVVLTERLLDRGDSVAEVERRIHADTVDLHEFEFMADAYILNVDFENALSDVLEFVEKVEKV
jgi:guanylate kinase